MINLKNKQWQITQTILNQLQKIVIGLCQFEIAISKVDNKPLNLSYLGLASVRLLNSPNDVIIELSFFE